MKGFKYVFGEELFRVDDNQSIGKFNFEDENLEYKYVVTTFGRWDVTRVYSKREIIKEML